MACAFSFSQEITSVQVFCLVVKLQKEVLDHRTNPLKKKKSLLLISTIFCWCMNNWEANLQKHRDYTSLKMPCFKNVWVADFTAETHDICKSREWVEGEEYFPYKWISEASSLSSISQFSIILTKGQ